MCLYCCYWSPGGVVLWCISVGLTQCVAIMGGNMLAPIGTEGGCVAPRRLVRQLYVGTSDVWFCMFVWVRLGESGSVIDQ